MSRTNVVLQNQYGGFYTAGRPLGKAKWISVIHLYDRELEINGRSTVRKLAELASVSKNTAWQAMQLVIPSERGRGHNHRGPGSILGFTMEHNSFIFS